MIAWLSKISSNVITKSAIQTDNRVRFMLSILKGIQTVKMYAWEISFGKLLRVIRGRELYQIGKSANLKAARLSFHITSDIALFVSLVVYVMLGNKITAQKAFVTIGYFNYIDHTLVEYWPLALSCVFEGIYSAIPRIQEFLIYEKLESIEKNTSDNSKLTRIIIQNASANYNIDGVESVAISSVNLNINEDTKLTAIVGQVGSGKTSLLEVILKEIPLKQGTIDVNGVISYASQQPWIFEGTIRQNILFTQTYDAERYNSIIQVCALERDFELFINGDKTLVGDRGVSLSGGQKARINLARAIYRNADIYLLDDPLSAVDVNVGKHIFTHCIKDFLKNKIVLLVTHQIQYLKDVPLILVMSKGEVKFHGNYDQVMNTEIGRNFIQSTSTADQKNLQNEEDIEKCETMNKEKVEPENDDKNDESQELGKVNKIVYKTYFLASESVIFISIVGFLLLSTQLMYSLLNYFISLWVHWEETYNQQSKSEVFDIFNSDWWTTEKFIYFYSFGIALLAFFMVSGAFAFYRICLRISLKLHERLFNSVIRATMYFFNTNSSGRILNRFSKDLGIVDGQLPMVVLDVLRVSDSQQPHKIFFLHVFIQFF